MSICGSVLRHTRLHLYLPSCYLTAMMGLLLAQSRNTSLFFWLGAANTAVMLAAFVFNDMEDGDRQWPVGTGRGAAGTTLYRIGPKGLVYIAALLGLALSFAMGSGPGFFTLMALTCGLLYSWRRFRLKARPIWDFSLHGLTATALFLAACCADPSAKPPFLAMVAAGYGFFAGSAASLLKHQLYDLESDRQARLRTTALALGQRPTRWLTFGLLLSVLVATAVASVRSRFPVDPILTFLLTTSACLAVYGRRRRGKRQRLTRHAWRWAINGGAIGAQFMWLTQVL